MIDKNIGFIGLGVMGQSMAGHILAAGFNVRVYNRTKQKADALVDQGAVWCDTVADLAASSDVIITMVGYPADVKEVFIGPDGILENAPAGSLAIDMTTSDPVLAEKLWQDGRQKDIGVLDAPVSGGDIGARNASLPLWWAGLQMIFTVPCLFLRSWEPILYIRVKPATANTQRWPIRLPLPPP